MNAFSIGFLLLTSFSGEPILQGLVNPRSPAAHQRGVQDAVKYLKDFQSLTQASSELPFTDLEVSSENGLRPVQSRVSGILQNIESLSDAEQILFVGRAIFGEREINDFLKNWIESKPKLSRFAESLRLNDKRGVSEQFRFVSFNERLRVGDLNLRNLPLSLQSEYEKKLSAYSRSDKMPLHAKVDLLRYFSSELGKQVFVGIIRISPPALPKLVGSSSGDRDDQKDN